MPSAKSKKNSKSASRLSSSSSLSSQQVAAAAEDNSSNIDEKPSEQELLKALEEASKRFPSLISTTAFIGTVSESATATSFDAADSKGGCKIWLSESAMVSANITPGSIVSVSLAASARFSCSFPLSSLALECKNQFDFDFTEDSADEPGSYFSLATVLPSCKVSKNGVRLSSNLSCTLGFPHLGRTVFVYPVCFEELAGVDKGNNKFYGARAGQLSTSESKELILTPVISKRKLMPNKSKVSHIDSPMETDAQSDNGAISSPSSPKTPSLSQSKLCSLDSGQLSTPGFRGPIARAPDFYGSSSKGLDIEQVLEDDASKKLLQACLASWLYSRILLSGNLVSVPVLSSLVVFRVTGADKSSANCNSQNFSGRGNKMFPKTVGRGTKVLINILENHELLTSGREVTEFSGLEQGHVKANMRIDSSNLGGLSEEFGVLRDIIIESTVKGTLASMGLRPTKGVLLHGPPGTGKTSLARLCAQDSGVNLFSVNGPEIITQYHGESEQALHEVFESASQAAPAVVFIDELDAIAPARRDGGEELSQRMVATLLNLMDGISRADGVLVIAATNRPDSIEPALRRPGRLDREIEIGVPSPKQRHDILHALLSRMEHSLSGMEIQNLATATHGFVGADLAALCNEAALVCLRRYVDSDVSTALECQLPLAFSGSSEDVSGSCVVKANALSLNNHLEDVSSSIRIVKTSAVANNAIEDNRTFMEDYHSLRIAFEDFEKARMRIRPSAMREVILEVPKVNWSDVGGQREVKMQLMEAVEWPQKHQDAFKRIGTRPPTGILMFGPPGCSKTLLARAVASESGLNFLAVKGPELFSKWVGESEKAVKSLFAKARANAPSIIFFDEIDGLAVIRGKESDGVSVSDRVMSQLLVELDGLHQRLNVTVIAATNRPDKIDPALLRPGRFDRLLYVAPPSERDREDIFRVHLQKIPHSPDVCFKELAILTEGFTGADISLVCREAAITAIEENIDALEVTMKHLEAGIKQVQPSELQSYQKLSKKFQRLVQSTAVEDDQSTKVHPSQSSYGPLWMVIRAITGLLSRFSASL